MSAPNLISPTTLSGGTPVGGTGTTNTIPRWTGPSTLGDSQLKDNGTLVGIGASLTSGNRLVIGGVASGTSFIKANEATFQIGNIFAGPVQILTSDTPQVTVTGTGNVGIGTPSPGNSKLNVTDASAFAFQAVNIVASGTNQDAGLRLQGSGGKAFRIQQPNTSAGIFFYDETNSAERARIDSAGRLLVGVSGVPVSSEIKAAIGGAGNGGQEWIGATGGGIACVPINGGGGQYYTFTGLIGAESYTASFKAISTGLDVSTAGYGLKLPATPGNTDPNTLDCYADGGTANSGGVTWTPTLRFGGATTGITYSAQVGRYTRIGNMIHATGVIALTSKGSATGSVSIAGLPTSANLADLNSSITIGYLSNITFGGQATGWIPPNSGTITLMKSTSGTTPTVMQDTDFAATSTIFFSVSYPVT